MTFRVSVCLMLMALEVSSKGYLHVKLPMKGCMTRFINKSCSHKSGDAIGFSILDDTVENTNWPRDLLCMAIPNTPAVHVRDYTVFVHLLNDISRNLVNNGHPGLVYNFLDSENYDFVFIRPHSPKLCFGYGYVLKGKLFYDYTKSGICKNGAPKGGKWHYFKLHVNGRTTRLFVNNRLLASFNHHFRNIAKGGPALLNGFKNRVLFKQFS